MKRLTRVEEIIANGGEWYKGILIQAGRVDDGFGYKIFNTNWDGKGKWKNIHQRAFFTGLTQAKDFAKMFCDNFPERLQPTDKGE